CWHPRGRARHSPITAQLEGRRPRVVRGDPRGGAPDQPPDLYGEHAAGTVAQPEAGRVQPELVQGIPSGRTEAATEVHDARRVGRRTPRHVRGCQKASAEVPRHGAACCLTRSFLTCETGGTPTHA